MKKKDFVYDIEAHEKFLLEQMDERCRRLYLGLQAMRLGYYGVASISQSFNVNKHTVRRGKKELLERRVPPVDKVRQKGGGRKKNSTHKQFD